MAKCSWTYCLKVICIDVTFILRDFDVTAFTGCQAVHKLVGGIESRWGTTRCNLESDLIQENMTKSSQWFLRESGIFPGHGKEGRAQTWLRRPDYVSTAWHWLQMHISESPVKLPVCCLYHCFVSLVEHQPALGKVHAKSITQFLSAFLLKELFSPFCMPVGPSSNCRKGNSVIVSFFYVGDFIYHCYSRYGYTTQYVYSIHRTCANNWLLWK